MVKVMNFDSKKSHRQFFKRPIQYNFFNYHNYGRVEPYKLQVCNEQ